MSRSSKSSPSFMFPDQKPVQISSLLSPCIPNAPSSSFSWIRSLAQHLVQTKSHEVTQGAPLCHPVVTLLIHYTVLLHGYLMHSDYSTSVPAYVQFKTYSPHPQCRNSACTRVTSPSNSVTQHHILLASNFILYSLYVKLSSMHICKVQIFKAWLSLYKPFCV